MRISDWSSDVCSSDLALRRVGSHLLDHRIGAQAVQPGSHPPLDDSDARGDPTSRPAGAARSEEHTSELQSLMRISYAVFCLKKKKIPLQHQHTIHENITYKHNTTQNHTTAE